MRSNRENSKFNYGILSWFDDKIGDLISTSEEENFRRILWINDISPYKLNHTLKNYTNIIKKIQHKINIKFSPTDIDFIIRSLEHTLHDHCKMQIINPQENLKPNVLEHILNIDMNIARFNQYLQLFSIKTITANHTKEIVSILIKNILLFNNNSDKSSEYDYFIENYLSLKSKIKNILSIEISEKLFH